uniref:leukocyte-associated immunoglobulin-like receptor 1 isoform X3 n=1 Tax=Halichoerus grypus TaxID=9711 RepID=UPI001658E01C|nr:leukocyte-associated immunoglobulin-like receptor 1 isoform X3 [Halichoerus grypus]
MGSERGHTPQQTCLGAQPALTSPCHPEESPRCDRVPGSYVKGEKNCRALPRPSIWAEPGSVIPQGQPVTIVCQGPAEAETFRLEKEGKALHPDAQNPQHETQARFRIRAASEDTAGLYHCLYHKGVDWSERSAPLQLEVTGDPQMHWEDSNSPGLSTEHVSILIGISVALFLCVLLLVLIFLYYQHQKKHMPPSSKGEEQRPQERVSLAVDILERTPDLATVDRLPEKDGEMLHTPTPTAGGPPDVTYAQLDHRILTQRTAQAASPRSMEPTAESSTYAALARH